MAFLGFGKVKRTSVTLIDIDSSSIGVALASLTIGKPPTICYATRTDIEVRSSEEKDEAMLRALREKVKELIERGAPLLRQQTGSGHSDHILVRIGAPWQKTLIRRERVEETKPFTYTEAIERNILRKKADTPEGYENIEETVLATLLNGYETGKPLGKQVRDVEVVIASSWVKEGIAPDIQKIIRSAYHTHALTFCTPSTISYGVLRKLFPHEKNYLVLEIGGESTNMLYVKSNILVKTTAIELGVNDIIRHARDGMSSRSVPSAETPRHPIIDSAENAEFAHSVESAELSWIKKIETLFQEFASEQALPRTIFLVAPEGTREYLTRLLDTPALRSLWLSDEPLRVVSIASAQLRPFVSVGLSAEQDTVLSLFTLFADTTIHTPLLKA